MPTFNTPLNAGNRPTSHTSQSSSGAGAGNVHAVLRINVGYRSLINWTNSPGWAQDASMHEGMFANQSAQPGRPGGRGGIARSPNEGALQVTHRWAGSNAGAPSTPATGKRVPGTVGVAYGVEDENVPAFNDSATHPAKAFGDHTPQWLYRLSEMLKWSGTMSLTELRKMSGSQDQFGAKGIYDPEETRQLNVGDWKAAIKSKYKKDRTFNPKTGRDFTGDQLANKYKKSSPTRKLRTVDNPDYNMEGNPFGFQGDDFVPEELTSPQTGWLGPAGTEASQWERFPKFGARGKNLHYSRTFSDLVYGNLSGSLMTQMNAFKVAVTRESANILNEIGFVRSIGSSGPASERVSSYEEGGQTLIGGGATGQEKMVEILGIGHAPREREMHVAGMTARPDPAYAPYGSRNIDVHLTADTVAANDLNYSRLDLTTSSYQAAAHHGIGPAQSRTTTPMHIATASRTVMTEQNRMIRTYNSVIRHLYTLYGTTDPNVLRRKIARSEIRHSQKRGGRSRQQLVGMLRGANIRGLGILQQVNADARQAQMNKILEHILHAIGNFLTADRTWASAMGIDLMTGSPAAETRGLLVLTYRMTRDGQFQMLRIQDINIQEYTLETWLYGLSAHSRGQLSQEQAMSDANAALSITGHVAHAIEAGIYRSAYSVGGSAVAHIAEVIPGFFSERMDEISFGIIDGVSRGAERQLERSMVTEATSFSRRMRTSLAQTDMISWMQGISDVFLRGTQLPSNPFWYLWTAPYISTGYPQIGFGRQFSKASGSTTGSSKF